MKNDELGFTVLFLEDILHTGHHGTEGERKVGEKYDMRRGKVTMFYEDSLCEGMGTHLLMFEWDEEACCYFLRGRVRTTAFERLYTENGYTMLRTLNSVYKFRELNAEEEKRLSHKLNMDEE